jgi:hypothetical protein
MPQYTVEITVIVRGDTPELAWLAAAELVGEPGESDDWEVMDVGEPELIPNT